jgi:filamentous hemagglutinin
VKNSYVSSILLILILIIGNIPTASAGGFFRNSGLLAGIKCATSKACRTTVSTVVKAGKEVAKLSKTSKQDFPPIKPGSSGGATAGRGFPKSVRDAAKNENSATTPYTCVYCRLKTDKPQVDHAIPKSKGGNATIDNAQIACPHCNASKGNREFPVTPPKGMKGPFAPEHWKIK